MIDIQQPKDSEIERIRELVRMYWYFTLQTAEYDSNSLSSFLGWLEFENKDEFYKWIEKERKK